MILKLQTSVDPRLTPYTQLTNRQLRRSLEAKEGLFVAESTYVIEKACEAHMIPHSLLLAERKVESLRPLLSALPSHVPVFVLPDEAIETLTGYRVHRGVLGLFERPALPTVEDVLKGAQNICVLEASVDATNVGAIFRSAASLGADGVLLDPTCADPFERRCVRVSMGCVFSVPWARFETWPHGGIELLADHGFTVVSCALSPDAQPLKAFSLAWRKRRARQKAPLALVFGTEGEGLAQSTIAASDLVVRIPMERSVDSLNVACAASVFFWELFGERSSSTLEP